MHIEKYIVKIKLDTRLKTVKETNVAATCGRHGEQSSSLQMSLSELQVIDEK